jgi:hypothetical protein
MLLKIKKIRIIDFSTGEKFLRFSFPTIDVKIEYFGVSILREK